MVETVPLVLCLGLDLHSRRGRDVSQVACDIDALKFIPKATPTTSISLPFASSLSAPSSTSARFLSAFVRASTAPWRSPPSRAASPPRSWICLSAPRSRIIHRGSCAEPQASSSSPHALTTLELSRWVSSARLPFAFARRPLLGAGYTSRSHPTLPLRVRRDALAVKQARIAFLLLMRVQRDPFAPVKQLWLLHHRTCASWMERRADGDRLTIQMHVDEDGEARGRGWECRWRWNPALALVPTLAFPLVPALRERRRRFRLGEMEKRGCGYGYSRCSAYALCNVDIEAGVYACGYGLTLPSSSHSRSSSSDPPLFFYMCLASVEVGMEMENPSGCAYILPSPSLQSLATFLFKLDRIPVIYTI
ncbi:hypothetical protein B0H13DRAFT_2378517 [Mycena leptocephala]|nr:hypothetical protein B0H13DRAFT_2378517 [Mycena leptocephala]